MAEDESTNGAARLYRRWIKELSSAITPRRSASSTWRTLLQNGAEGLEVYKRSGNASKHLGTLKADAGADQVLALKHTVQRRADTNPKHVLLRLSADDVLERTIQIPKAASDVIEPVLRNQMERIVPWPEDDTRYGFSVIGPNSKSPDQLDLKVVATTRNIMDAIVDRARAIGLSPYLIEYVSAEGGKAPIELMSFEPDPAKKTAQLLSTILASLLVATVIIAGFGLYSTWNRQVESDDLEAEIAAATARVQSVSQLTEENSRLKEQRERLAKRKTEMPPVMVLMEVLSRALPDSAYLTEFEFHGKDARIAGKSDNPTALITKLENTAQFEDVRFAAPTTREENEKVETFSIIGRAEPDLKME